MKKKIRRSYKCTTLPTYNDAMKAILENNFSVSIYADRNNLTIILEFDAEDTAAIQEMTDVVKNMEVIISDYLPAFMFAEGREFAQELEFEKEKFAAAIRQANNNMADLKGERDSIKCDCDKYKEAFREKLTALNRVKSQIKAIAVLLNAICPEKQ